MKDNLYIHLRKGEHMGKSVSLDDYKGTSIEKGFKTSGLRRVGASLEDLNKLKKAISKREDVSESDKKAAKEEYGDVSFADEKNKKYPLDTEEHVRAAASYFGMEKNRSKYSADEQKIIQGKIKSAEKKFKIGQEGK